MKKVTMFLGSLLLSTAVFAQSNTATTPEITAAPTERGRIEVGLDLVSPLLKGAGLYTGIALSNKFVLQARVYDYTLEEYLFLNGDYKFKNSGAVLALDFYPLGNKRHSGWYISVGAQTAKVEFSSEFSDSNSETVTGARLGTGYSWSGIRLGDSMGLKFKVGAAYGPTATYEVRGTGETEVSGGLDLDGSVSIIF